MKHVACSAAAGLLLAAAATAFGQAPVIDGTKDASYGAPLWVNTANPTGFGDNVPGNYPCSSFGSGMQLAINNSNIAGVAGAGSCTSSGAGVTTGIEIKIPFSAINNPTDATFKISGFVIGQNHDFVSNQVIGGSTACIANLGEVRNVTFTDSDATGVPGNQFVTVSNGAGTDPTGPSIDGTLDAAFYGTALWTNNIDTGFGDNTDPTPALANGSEIDGVYARIATVAGEKSLYVFISGNLETNFNKVWVFLDCFAGQGQNQLLNNNPNLDFNGLNRLGRTNNAATDGLKFDVGFDCDYALTCTNGGTPTTTFANLGETLTAGGGQGRFVGQAPNPSPIIVAPCTPTALPVPSPDKAYGSEIDAIYAKACGDFLYVFVAGNLEVNNNNLDLFFDVDGSTTNGGQHTLRADNVSVGFGGLNRMGAGNEGPGLTFDAGFSADYWVAYHNSGFNVADAAAHASEAAFLRSTGAQGDSTSAQGMLDYGSFVSGAKATINPLVYDGSYCVRDVMGVCSPNGAGSPFNPSSLPGIDVQGDLTGSFNQLSILPDIFSSFAPRLISPQINFCIDPPTCATPDLSVAGCLDPLGTSNGRPNLTVPGLIAITNNNSNIAGVTDTTATGGDLVTTGVELKIRLDEIGWDGQSAIKICAFVNGSGHDFLSNQVSGGLPANAANLGEARAVNFDDTASGIVGNQFVSVTYAANCSPIAVNGACCCGSNCSITTAAACNGANRVFNGAATTCVPFSNTVPCCRANYNKSASSPNAPGGVSVQDIFDFLTGYFSVDACANTNDSAPTPQAPNGVSVQDIFDFLAAYFGGCQ